MSIVTLLSDYGTTDGYVAEVKATLMHSRKLSQIVDITHEIPPFNTRHAAFQLWRTYSFFPSGTWHLALVEPASPARESTPGTQGRRFGVYVRTQRYHFVGPDNGILKWAVEDAERREGSRAQVYRLSSENRLEAGYWGRDCYAAAVREGLDGQPPVGALKEALSGSHFPTPEKGRHGEVRAEVLTWDVFGNIITSLPLQGIEKGRGKLGQSGDFIDCFRDYAELPESGVGLIPGSNGLWEISARNASAQDLLAAKPGELFTWYP